VDVIGDGDGDEQSAARAGDLPKKKIVAVAAYDHVSLARTFTTGAVWRMMRAVR
jgi:hypothetical protein